MKILFIGKRFYTNRDAFTERFGRIYQLPKCWSETGHDAFLWLIDYRRKTFEYKTDSLLEIFSTPVFSFSLVKLLLKTIFSKKKPDIVLASGDSYIGLLAYTIAKLINRPFVFDIYDKYDEFNGYRRLPFFDPLSFLVRNSSALIFASKALLDVFDPDSKKSILAPNGIDRSHFRPLDMMLSRQKFDLPNAVTFVGYFGSMEPDRGIDDLISATRLLREQDQNVVLLLGGNKPASLDLEIDGVVYLGNLNFSHVPAALACCDVLVLPYKNSPFLDMASSCKIAEYIAVQRPIVSTNTPNFTANFPDHAKLLGEGVCPPSDPAALAEAINYQLENRILVAPIRSMEWQEIAEFVIQQANRR
jgi:glycosyltransferase involved in cell wall biosynthesis